MCRDRGGGAPAPANSPGPARVHAVDGGGGTGSNNGSATLRHCAGGLHSTQPSCCWRGWVSVLVSVSLVVAARDGCCESAGVELRARCRAPGLDTGLIPKGAGPVSGLESSPLLGKNTSKAVRALSAITGRLGPMAPTRDTVPVIERENYRRVHVALHTLWTQQVGLPGYDKNQWKALEQAIFRLATDGPGQQVKAPF
jgi:hypothetical protein